MDKLNKEQSLSHSNLLYSEEIFLRSFGWIYIDPITIGAPVFWRDPMGDDERSQDVAVSTQKLRVNTILYRD